MRQITKISDNIYFYRRRIPSSNTTLIKGEPNILIDPGYNPKGNLRVLLPLFKEAGITIKDIDEIWFTHNHPDHTQMAYYLLQKKDMKVISHPLAKRILETEPPIRGLIEMEKETLLPILNRIYPGRIGKRRTLENLLSVMIQLCGRPLSIGAHSIRITDTFADGEERYGITIVFFPGHTPDEVGFFLNSTLITGDLIATFSFKRPAVLNIPSSDIDDAISSLEKILTLSLKWILPGHGACVRIDSGIVNEIYRHTVALREYGISLIKKVHSFIPFVFGLQRALPLTVTIMERCALIPVIYKSYVAEVTQPKTKVGS